MVGDVVKAAIRRALQTNDVVSGLLWFYRHNTWWGKWTCSTCVRWAWEDRHRVREERR
jgi:predicted ATP-dependent Lon-type protease